ncbi:MAG: ABC transporter ATP-binding protein [Gemmatales bacterium]
MLSIRTIEKGEILTESKDKHIPVKVESLKKKFLLGSNTVTALDGVSLSIQPGEFVAIMGASGSGKSTLLHAMAGLTDVDEGKVVVDGQDLSSLSDSQLTRFRRNRIGLVFQAFNLIPTLSAEDNVALPCEDEKLAKSRTSLLLERLGMSARKHHKPDALSGGEQQRVAIARALISEPTILFADEPTGSLDSVSGQEICSIFQNLSQNHGCTIVIVTHEPQVAMWAQRVVVLKDGQILAEFQNNGDHEPSSVAQQYQHALFTKPVKS